MKKKKILHIVTLILISLLSSKVLQSLSEVAIAGISCGVDAAEIGITIEVKC